MAGEPPEQSARWFYALEDRWQTFNDEDDTALEKRWELLEKEGLLAKRKREREEEVEEKKKQKQKEKMDRNQEIDEGIVKKVPFLRAPPSGVDQVRKGVFDALGKGEKEEDTKEETKDRTVVNEQLDPDEPDENLRFRVEVMEDHLFEVDIGNMQLFPVFWKGVLLKVVRAKWFYASQESAGHAPIPYDESLSSDLDSAYGQAAPWRGTSEEKKGKADDQNELYDLPSMNNEGKIHFQDAFSGRIFTQNLSGKVMALLGGSLVIRGWKETANRSKSESGLLQQTFLPWAGGHEQKDEDDDGDDVQDSKRAQKKQGAAKAPSKAPASGPTRNNSSKEEEEGGFFRLWPSSDGLLRPGVNLLRSLGWGKEDANEEGQRAAKQKNTEKSLQSDGKDQRNDEKDTIPDDRKDEPPELVFAIHGIGQKMVEEWDAIDFVYDVEKLRNVSKKVAGDAAMRKVSRGKRAQYLPISWRKDLSFDEEEAREGNDNVYTLDDISNDAAIPVVRNVISKVVLDVPYYLSRHKVKMISAVRSELNRVYRLFVRRNPHFEEQGGRVSLICHSLGSAIAADILSQQPTLVKPLKQQTKEDLTSNKHLLFNVKNLFFIGSPNGFFFYLEGAQLIARRGTARTKDVASDAASDQVGRYGCMAAEAVYNCYNTTDPVAFQLSATVDAQYARSLRPISIPDAVPALLEALSQPRLALSKLFDPVHPFADGGTSKPAYKVETKSVIGPSSQTNSGVNTPKRKELGEGKSSILLEEGTGQKESQVRQLMQEGKNEKDKSEREENISDSSSFNMDRLERAERRFRALNPHGCIDFTYDSGGFNQYLDMLSAHISYWQSNSFATFVLLQLFSDFEKEEAAPTIVPTVDPQRQGKNEQEQEQKAETEDDTEGSDEDENSLEDDDKQSTRRGLLAALSPSGIL